MASQMTPLEKVEAEIQKVHQQIISVEAVLKNETDKEEKAALRKEKEQLRKEKEQLREEKLLVLRKDAATNSGMFSLSSFCSCGAFVLTVTCSCFNHTRLISDRPCLSLSRASRRSRVAHRLIICDASPLQRLACFTISLLLICISHFVGTTRPSPFLAADPLIFVVAIIA